ncbi:MAG: DUF1425 domain-containing protein [Phycisphaerae bacterium]|nr:DUF1425 domain-containing protein [Phycisphaerae bacterium]
MLKNLALGAMTLSVAVSAGGCDPQRRTPGVREDPQPTGSYPIVAVEPGLQRYLGVDSERVVVDPATESVPMKVSVPVRSLADNQMAVQYEFTWFDDKGREVGRSGWLFVMLEPRVQRHFSANSVTTRARGWRMEVRSAR